MLRRSLEQWFDAEGIRPLVRGEFADPALLKSFAQNGVGIFAARTVVEEATCRLYKVRLLGRVESIRERLYAISVEKRLKHPAVIAITQAARGEAVYMSQTSGVLLIIFFPMEHLGNFASEDRVHLGRQINNSASEDRVRY